MKCVPKPICRGIVLTKYGHIRGKLPGVLCLEAGHPIPDRNSVEGTQKILQMTQRLKATDTVLFLLSGGGSALFESPLISLDALKEITERMLRAGMDIGQINTIRKHLSAVKGGRFAQWCLPAKVETIILSDVLGDKVDMIASGPTVADPSTCAQAMELAKKFGLLISPRKEKREYHVDAAHGERPGGRARRGRRRRRDHARVRA